MSLPNALPPGALLEVVGPSRLIQEPTAPSRAWSHSKASLPSRIAVIGKASYERHGDVDDVVFPCG